MMLGIRAMGWTRETKDAYCVVVYNAAGQTAKVRTITNAGK